MLSKLIGSNFKGKVYKSKQCGDYIWHALIAVDSVLSETVSLTSQGCH